MLDISKPNDPGLLHRVQPLASACIGWRYGHVSTLAVGVALLALLTTAPAEAATTVLYDPALSVNSMPDQQGWQLGAFSPDLVVDTTAGVGSGVLNIDTMLDIDDYFGYFTHNPITGAALGSLPSYTLDRQTGFTLTFHAAIHDEDHSGPSGPNRGGFSVLFVSTDATKALEIAFRADQLFSYNSDFTIGESAVRNTAPMTRYDVVVLGDAYAMFADADFNAPILTGALRDYTGFAGLSVPFLGTVDPYEKPNMIFFGDDTTSARADVSVGPISVTVVPEPSTLALLACGLLAAGLVRRWA
jgi:hypothetical protein